MKFVNGLVVNEANVLRKLAHLWSLPFCSSQLYEDRRMFSVDSDFQKSVFPLREQFQNYSIFVVVFKDGNMVRRYGTVRLNFAKKYVTLVQYAFFVKVRVRYVGTLFELKVQDFSHNAPAFCIQRQKTAETDAKCVNWDR